MSSSLPTHSRPGARPVRWVRMMALLLASTGAIAQSPSNTPVEVRAGDTFSALAAPFAGGARYWGKVYDAQRSGLSDPNRIYPGMRFELVEEAGRRYLRLIGGGARDMVAARPAPSPAPQAAATAASVSVYMWRCGRRFSSSCSTATQRARAR